MLGPIVIPGNCLFGQGGCTDLDLELHSALMTRLFPRSADVMSAEGSGTAVEDLESDARGGGASGHGSSYR